MHRTGATIDDAPTSRAFLAGHGRRWFASLAAAMSFPVAGFAEDDAGELIYNNTCRTCHVTKEGDNRLGPSLANIVGRKAGASEGFAYSDSVKNSGIVWDEKTLDQFIANPDDVVPNNNMKPYTGVASAEDRAKIIQFLKAGGTK